MKSFRTRMQDFAISQMLENVTKNSKENIQMVLNWLQKIDINGQFLHTWSSLLRGLDDPQNNMTQLMTRFYTDLNPRIRRKFTESFLCNSLIIGSNASKISGRKYGIQIPNVIALDPTSVSNQRNQLFGTFSYEATLDLNVMQRIIREAKELGIFMFVFLGGEPFLKKEEIFHLCEMNQDCYFLAFTNGSMIHEKEVKQMVRVANLAVMLQAEGMECEMDKQCGEGSFQDMQNAMILLKKNGLPFGLSICYRYDNVGFVGTESYLDYLIERGAMFVWYVPYMPVGELGMENILSSEQRKFMYYQIHRFRKAKPIFICDFMFDNEQTGGCIAGGRKYIHINAKGDVEPCVFVRYSSINIHQVSLLEALQSPLFRSYQKRQPFNRNHLCGCPVMDNPQCMEEMIVESNAYSTDSLSDMVFKKCYSSARRWCKEAECLKEEMYRKQTDVQYSNQR